MTVRKNFGMRYVNGQLTVVAEKLAGKTTIYLAGGTAMAIEGLKEGTKDIDVVVESADDLTRLKKALTTLGYSKPNQSLEVAYQRMEAGAGGSFKGHLGGSGTTRAGAGSGVGAGAATCGWADLLYVLYGVRALWTGRGGCA